MRSSAAPSALATDLHKVFVDNDLRWNIGGKKVIPTAEDLQVVLARAKYEVEYQQVNSHLKNTKPQVEMRHLTFKMAENGSVEVFVKIGEIE